MSRVKNAEQPVLPEPSRPVPVEWQASMARTRTRRGAFLSVLILMPILLSLAGGILSLEIALAAGAVGASLLCAALFWYWVGESGMGPDLALLQGGLEVHARVPPPGAAPRDTVAYSYDIDGKDFLRRMDTSHFDEALTVAYPDGGVCVVLLVDPDNPWRHFVVPREGYEELMEQARPAE